MTEVQETPSGTVEVKVTLGIQVKRAADGAIEDHSPGVSQLVEVDYQKAVEMFGVEEAGELFAARDGGSDGS